LFGALLLLALLVSHGRLETSDEVLMAMTSHAIATRFSLTFPEAFGQTFTGYGVGMPLAGIPALGLEWLARRAGLGGDFSLMPLTSAVLFALTGVLAARLASVLSGISGAKPFVLSGVLFAASPLFPASATFYSEMLASAGLVAVALAMAGRERPWVAVALGVLGALAAVLARPAMVPLVGLVLAWKVLMDRRVGSAVVAGAVGLAGGVAVRLFQNSILRGSPLAQGYDGQEFTTPFLTGLFGLLLSPERGLLVHAPLTLLALVAARGERNDVTRFGRLVAVALVGWTAMHAAFWTWHGGWTMGPRFLLPVIALAVPLVVARWSAWEGAARASAPVLALWSGFVAAVYALVSPIMWWNRLWVFHQLESRWLFEPQLSVLANWPEALWREGAKPFVLSALVPQAAITPLATALWMAALAALGWILWRSGGRSRRTRAVLAATGVLLLLSLLPASGFRVETDGTQPRSERVPMASLLEPGELSGLVDLRPHGTYTLHVRASGRYRVLLDGEVLAEAATAEPPHSLSHPVGATESGERLLEIEVFATDPPGGVDVFWTWPGEGRLMQPVGGAYTRPSGGEGGREWLRPLARHRIFLVAAGLALVLLLAVLDGATRKETGVEP
jgi:hypothetical protein